MRELHIAVIVVMKSLQEVELKWFALKSIELVSWNCISLLLLYCRVIPDDKDMSAV